LYTRLHHAVHTIHYTGVWAIIQYGQVRVSASIILNTSYANISTSAPAELVLRPVDTYESRYTDIIQRWFVLEMYTRLE